MKYCDILNCARLEIHTKSSRLWFFSWCAHFILYRFSWAMKYWQYEWINSVIIIYWMSWLYVYRAHTHTHNIYPIRAISANMLRLTTLMMYVFVLGCLLKPVGITKSVDTRSIWVKQVIFNWIIFIHMNAPVSNSEMFAIHLIGLDEREMIFSPLPFASLIHIRRYWDLWDCGAQIVMQWQEHFPQSDVCLFGLDYKRKTLESKRKYLFSCQHGLACSENNCWSIW